VKTRFKVPLCDILFDEDLISPFDLLPCSNMSRDHDQLDFRP
jgi:hypothetical protein